MKAKDQRIFLEALDELEKEKGIKKEELLEAIETALLAALCFVSFTYLQIKIPSLIFEIVSTI